MLCKWCGADVPNSAVKCPRCHKELPAKSDCGGYYDIVSAPKTGEHMGFQQAPAEIVRERIVPQKTKSNLVQIALAAVACAGILVAIVLIFAISGNLSKTTATANQNGRRADQILTELRRVHGESQCEINVSVDHEDEGNTVKTTAKLGDYTNAVSTAVTLDEKTGDISKVQINMGATKNAVVVTINKETKENQTSFEAKATVNDEIFGEQKDAVAYKWQCKLGGTWLELSDEQFAEVVKRSEDGATITVNDEKLAPLFESEQKLELRVVCTRTNTSDEALAVTVSGICLEKAAAETTPSLEIEAITVEEN